MRAIMKKMQALTDRDDLIGFWCSLLFAIVLPSVLVGVLVLCIVGCVVAVAGSPFPSEADAAAEGYVAGKEGMPASANPHGGYNASGSAYEAWARGWASGWRDRRKEANDVGQEMGAADGD